MNCRDCNESLSQFVDRELNESEVEEVKQHLSDCPPCDHRYKFEAELKRVIKVSCSMDRTPPELREKLRQILF